MATDIRTLRHDLGPVSAYAIAVAEGYIGTRAQWEQQIANAALNAQAAEGAKNAAEAATVHQPEIGVNGNWYIWNQQLGAYQDSNRPSGIAIHICVSGEYDSQTGVPTIQNPAMNIFYLVPDGESPDMFVEWVYTGTAWEIFGSARVDLSGYATKADTVLETTLSRGRKEGTTVGTGSFAFGNNVEASGVYSVATGYRSSAIGAYSYAGGYSSQALNAGSFAMGEDAIAKGSATLVNGRYNIIDNYGTLSEWEANKSYVIGDKVKRTTIENDETIVRGYIAKKNSNRSSFYLTDWKENLLYNFVRIVGNGTADDARSNAYALDWDGNGYFMGDVFVGCNPDSSGGTKLAKLTDLPEIATVAEMKTYLGIA